MSSFIREINDKGANVSETLLLNGLKNIRWMELMDEFEILEVAERYKDIRAFDIKRHFDEAMR